MRRAWLATLVLIAAAAGAEAAPPGWVKEVTAVRAGPSDAPAVVLLDEVTLTISSDGRTRTSRRYAVRVQDRAGREAAVIREIYLAGGGRVREIRGWLVSAGGSTRELGSREAVDAALVNNDVFNEVRVRALGAIDDVADGDVFAAEVESEDRLLYAQLDWPLQGRFPVHVARRRLNLPDGWRAEPVYFNMAPVEPRREGTALAWHLNGLAALDGEPAMPPGSGLSARIALSVFGPASAAAPGQFQTWSDVASWLFALSDQASRPTATVAAKARELTAAATTDYERARAIGSFVQRIQYVSVQTGIGRGGGYQPRPAALVLERNYGDCKDKAGLMRAMLSAVGIESSLVSIFAGDRGYVRPEWPTPQQFNHAIIAISLTDVPPGTPALVEDAAIGPLLVFDPTDEHTAFGELPLHEQGSLALLVTPAARALLRMPLVAPRANGIERTIEVMLDEQGNLDGTIHERLAGWFASATRAQHRSLESAAFSSTVARRISSTLRGVVVRDVTARDDEAARRFTIRANLNAQRYGRFQGKLLLIVPPFDAAGRLDLPAAKQRRHPLLIDPALVTETVRVTLGAGFEIDELPQTVTVEGAVGRFELTYRVEGDVLVARRVLETRAQTISAEDAAAAAAFFDAVRAADSVPVVLVQKGRQAP